MEEYDVIVVGGGIGGLAVGYGLAAKGYKICILESRSEVRPSKRGLTLQSNGLEALQKLGLLENVERLGVKRRLVAWYDVNGELLSRFDYSILKHPQNYLLTVIPSELELFLRKQFFDKGGVLCDSSLFSELISENTDRLQVRAQRNRSLLELGAKMVVGADGENSRVREYLKIPSRIKQYADHFLFTLLGPLDLLREEARQYFSRGKMMGFFPTSNSTYLFYYVHEGGLDELKRRGLSSFKTELAKVEPEVSKALVSLQSWNDLAYVAPKRVSAQTWVADRVALLGDAVHALNPCWAQGANLTLQDAIVLVDTIQTCFESGDFTAETLKHYEDARRRGAEFVQRQSERTARITNTESRFYAWIGKRTLRKAGRNSTMMRLALESSSGLLDHIGLLDQLRFVL